MSSDKPKLYYFDMYGRAEAIRMAFWLAKQEFEDIRWSYADWPTKWKNSGKFFNGQAPLLEIDGQALFQSISILRYVCQKYGFYPTDPDAIYRTEAVIDYKLDIQMKLRPYMYNPDPEAKKAGFAKFYAEDLGPGLKTLEAFVMKSPDIDKGFIGGDKITMGDIVMVDFYSWLNCSFNKGNTEKLLEEVPDLVKYFKTRSEDFKEYLEKREVRPW